MKQAESVGNVESGESSIEELSSELLNSESLSRCVDKEFDIEDEDFLQVGKLTTHIMDRMSEGAEEIESPSFKNRLFSGLKIASQEELSKKTMQEGAKAMRDLYSGEDADNLNSLFLSISNVGVELRKNIDDNEKMDKFSDFQVKVIEAAT